MLNVKQPVSSRSSGYLRRERGDSVGDVRPVRAPEPSDDERERDALRDVLRDALPEVERERDESERVERLDALEPLAPLPERSERERELRVAERLERRLRDDWASVLRRAVVRPAGVREPRLRAPGVESRPEPRFDARVGGAGGGGGGRLAAAAWKASR